MSRLNPLPSAFTEQISTGPRSGFLAQARAILLPSGDQLEPPSTPLRLVSLVKSEPSGATEKRFAPSLVHRSKTILPFVPGECGGGRDRQGGGSGGNGHQGAPAHRDADALPAGARCQAATALRCPLVYSAEPMSCRRLHQHLLQTAP